MTTGHEQPLQAWVCTYCGYRCESANQPECYGPHSERHERKWMQLDDPPVLHIPCTCADDRSDGRRFAQHSATCAYGVAERALKQHGHRIEARA